jgi:hypothetical protein
LLRELKSIFRDQLGLPPWIVLAAVGCLAHVALNALLRKPITSGWGLLGPLGFGVALESYEIWIQYRTIGLIVPGNDPLLTILGRHGFDVLLMLAGPLLVVVVGAISAK